MMIKQKNILESNILWQPNEKWISESNLTGFSEQAGFPLHPYERFHRWSVAEPEAFWSEVWDFANIIGKKGERVFIPPTDGGMLGAQWFPDAELNFAENLLRGKDEHTAVIAAREDGVTHLIQLVNCAEKWPVLKRVYEI